MCGIVGFISKEKINYSVLKEMTDSIAHRGPDDSGYYIDNVNKLHIGLGHRRLSIIDLDKRSSQPFFNISNNIAIIYNGEIYNYVELKRDLKNYAFRTSSDTEVILALYETLGINFVHQLSGIFSFVIVDFRNGKTYIVRDRHGVKPLYYYMSHDHVVFASELRPIMKYPYFKKKINFLSLELMLSMRYVPSELTIFENVKKAKPGVVMIFEGTHLKEEIKYWDSIDEYEKTEKTNPSNDFYNRVINESVRRNLVSDVEVVTFLSGGVDSSLVTSVASKFDSKIKSYTIGFDSSEYDESSYAAIISNVLNITNKIKYLSIDDLADAALNISKVYDEPFADSSQLPSILICKEVKDDGIKVVLSGDGGDEFFYGYTNYSSINFRYNLFKIISPFVKLFKPLFKRFNRGIIFHILNLFTNIGLFFYGLSSGYAGYYSRTIMKHKNGYNEIKQVFDFLTRIKHLSPKEINVLYDQKIYLVDDILVKIDRASMTNSLEARVPLLDHQVSCAAYMSDKLSHYEGSKGKIILKKLLSDYISWEFIDRKKQGFSISLVELMKNDKIVKKLEFYVSSIFLNKQNIFIQREVLKIYNRFQNKNESRYASFLWSYFVFQSWYEEYMLK